MPRLGSAIASTILSVFGVVSLVGVDKAQAAVLWYTFEVEDVGAFGSFKVDDSLVTGIEDEEIALVSEGRAYASSLGNYKKQPREYYDLAGARAVFYQGVFGGLQAGGGEEITPEDNIHEDNGVPYYTNYTGSAGWSLYPGREGSFPVYDFYFEVIFGPDGISRGYRSGLPVTYTLVKTEPSPVPEPLTAGGTALALAGLSWLKHKKKMAA